DGREDQDLDVAGARVPLEGGEEVPAVHVLLEVEDDDRRLVADGELEDLLGRGVGDVGQARATRLTGQGGHDARFVVAPQDGGLLGHDALPDEVDRKNHTDADSQASRGFDCGVGGSPRLWRVVLTRSSLTSPKVDPTGANPLRSASLGRGVSASGSGSAW